MDTDSSASLKVLMFPWLAYGHISPFLGLAKILSDRGFCIYLCSTPVNLESIKHKINNNSVHLVEFPLEETSDFPSQFHTTNGLPTHLQSTLRKALHKAKPNLSGILEELKPDLIIYDIHQSWISGLSYRRNIPAVRFLTSGAGMLGYFFHLGRKPGIPFPFPEFYLTEYEQASFFSNSQTAKKDHDEEEEVEEVEIPKRPCDNILLLKSSKEIEGKYIDYLSELTGWKISPFYTILREAIDDEEDEEHELISWLKTKQERSTIFVSFGSEFFLNENELEEIAFGLELSGVNFIWVLRFPKDCDDSLEKALPDGFLDRTGDKSKVVKEWAPQARILSHPSIGGFVSHCGWNSVLEAMEIGVPIIAVPMHLDQPFISRLVVALRVGVEVKKDGEGKLTREEIAAAIKEVVSGTAGEEAMKNVRQLGMKLKAEETDGLDGIAQMLKTVADH